MKSLAEVLARVAQDHPTAAKSGNGSSTNGEVCPICHGTGFVQRDLPIGDPDFGKAAPCVCTLRTLAWERASQLRQVSNLGQLERLTFERFLPDGLGLPDDKRRSLRSAYDFARQFADAPIGWLVLQGGCGTGKTHLAAAIANVRLARGESVMFVVAPDLLDYLRAAFTPQSDTTFDQRFEQVRSTPLLILDDLGAHSTTPWAQEKLYQIVNYRYNAHLPTVITTNFRLEDLDERVRSRLVDPEISAVFHIVAPDFRQPGKTYDSLELNSLALHEDQRFDNFDLRGHELNGEERASLREALTAAQQFAQDQDGWLIFSGSYHCGKTHLAAAIARERHSHYGGAPMFVFVPDLLDFLRAAFNPASTVSLDERFEQVKKAELLVLDDLGAQSATTWASEKLFQLINYRYVARLPTVFTIALDNLPLETRFHARVFDPSRSREIKITAPAYRPALRSPAAAPRAARTRR